MDVNIFMKRWIWFRKEKVKVYTEAYPFKEIQQAYEKVNKGEVRFRAVIIYD